MVSYCGQHYLAGSKLILQNEVVLAEKETVISWRRVWMWETMQMMYESFNASKIHHKTHGNLIIFTCLFACFLRKILSKICKSKMCTFSRKFPKKTLKWLIMPCFGLTNVNDSPIWTKKHSFSFGFVAMKRISFLDLSCDKIFSLSVWSIVLSRKWTISKSFEIE